MAAAEGGEGGGVARGKSRLRVVSGLTLVPDGEHLDAVATRRYAVQRHVPGSALGDDEFAQPSPNRSADVRMTLEDLDRFDDRRRCREGGGRVGGSEKIEQPIKIREGPPAVRNGGQRAG